jgi:hypothetical protein
MRLTDFQTTDVQRKLRRRMQNHIQPITRARACHSVNLEPFHSCFL